MAKSKVIDAALTGKDVICRLLGAESGDQIATDQKYLHEAINKFM